MDNFRLTGYFRGKSLLTLSALTLFLGNGGACQGNAAERAKWENLIPAISDALSKQGTTCPGQQLRISIKDAVDLGGHSVALVDFCPGGAYTDWIAVIELKNGQPVRARFRKADGKLATLEFAEGASVMHGMDIRLIQEKRALYDISWDNELLDNSGSLRLQKCLVNAYVFNARTGTFEYNKRLTQEASKSYCEALKHQVYERRLTGQGNSM